MPSAPAPAAGAGQQRAQNASRPQDDDAFLRELMTANPTQRKNMIGERLYTLIHKTQPSLAGKITGMLLEGMDESELINLLTTPEELGSRIREAIDVLNQHTAKTSTPSA